MTNSIRHRPSIWCGGIRIWWGEDLCACCAPTGPTCLKSFWPGLVASGKLPQAAGVWEMTRVCVDKTVSPSLRRTILPELLAAANEFFVDQGSTGMIGVTRAHLLTH